MSQATLIQSIVDYLLRKKAEGKKLVFRTAIYAVMEDRHGTAAIADGRAITYRLLNDAAQLAGGSYVPAKNGNSKVVF